RLAVRLCLSAGLLPKCRSALHPLVFFFCSSQPLDQQTHPSHAHHPRPYPHPTAPHTHATHTLEAVEGREEGRKYSRGGKKRPEERAVRTEQQGGRRRGGGEGGRGQPAISTRAKSDPSTTPPRRSAMATTAAASYVKTAPTSITTASDLDDLAASKRPPSNAPTSPKPALRSRSPMPSTVPRSSSPSPSTPQGFSRPLSPAPLGYSLPPPPTPMTIEAQSPLPPSPTLSASSVMSAPRSDIGRADTTASNASSLSTGTSASSSSSQSGSGRSSGKVARLRRELIAPAGAIPTVLSGTADSALSPIASECEQATTSAARIRTINHLVHQPNCRWGFVDIITQVPMSLSPGPLSPSSSPSLSSHKTPSHTVRWVSHLLVLHDIYLYLFSTSHDPFSEPPLDELELGQGTTIRLSADAGGAGSVIITISSSFGVRDWDIRCSPKATDSIDAASGKGAVLAGETAVWFESIKAAIERGKARAKSEILKRANLEHKLRISQVPLVEREHPIVPVDVALDRRPHSLQRRSRPSSVISISSHGSSASGAGRGGGSTIRSGAASPVGTLGDWSIASISSATLATPATPAKPSPDMSRALRGARSTEKLRVWPWTNVDLHRPPSPALSATSSATSSASSSHPAQYKGPVPLSPRPNSRFPASHSPPPMSPTGSSSSHIPRRTTSAKASAFHAAAAGLPQPQPRDTKPATPTRSSADDPVTKSTAATAPTLKPPKRSSSRPANHLLHLAGPLEAAIPIEDSHRRRSSSVDLGPSSRSSLLLSPTTQPSPLAFLRVGRGATRNSLIVGSGSHTLPRRSMSESSRRPALFKDGGRDAFAQPDSSSSAGETAAASEKGRWWGRKK
ncbi:hypothetical protein DFJ73DRAFT_141421, partial [Zopfochytrium polystomum]